MDLSKTEDAIKKLEKNGKKIEKIADYLEQFQVLRDELNELPKNIEKNNNSIELRFKKLVEKIEKLPNEAEKNNTVLRNYISKLESEIKNHLKKNSDDLSNTISDFSKRLNEIEINQSSIYRTLKTFVSITLLLLAFNSILSYF